MLPKKSSMLYNILFLILCGGIFAFLWSAPDETTKRMPYNDIHKKFYTMKKSKADKQCSTCHNPEGVVPLPTKHPAKYRCLFCHKKMSQ